MTDGRRIYNVTGKIRMHSISNPSLRTLNKFKKPEKLSKKLSKKDKGEYWFFYVYGGFNKTQTFEKYIKWLATLEHFYYAFKNEKFYGEYFKKQGMDIIPFDYNI